MKTRRHLLRDLIRVAEDDEEDAKPPTAKASIDAASAAIVGKLAELEKALVRGLILMEHYRLRILVLRAALMYAEPVFPEQREAKSDYIPFAEVQRG
jgi:hypothetical protein